MYLRQFYPGIQGGRHWDLCEHREGATPLSFSHLFPPWSLKEEKIRVAAKAEMWQ